MGVPHLEKLRDFLESNAEKAYSRTELRDTLKQNFGTVKQNLKYLIEKEGTVERKEDTDKELYQWKKSELINYAKLIPRQILPESVAKIVD